MIDFNGKKIPENEKELLEPSRTVILVWDMQNEIAKRAFNYASIVQNQKKVLERARKVGVRIFYSQHTTLDWRDESVGWIRYRMKAERVSEPSQLKRTNVLGTDGWKIVDELSPQPGDVVFIKRRPSAFLYTDFDLLLRSLRIETVLVMGVATEMGIESTVRHGTYLGYNMVILEDGVGSFSREAHENAMKFLRRYFDVLSSDQVIAAWA